MTSLTGCVSVGGVDGRGQTVGDGDRLAGTLLDLDPIADFQEEAVRHMFYKDKAKKKENKNKGGATKGHGGHEINQGKKRKGEDKDQHEGKKMQGEPNEIRQNKGDGHDQDDAISQPHSRHALSLLSSLTDEGSCESAYQHCPGILTPIKALGVIFSELEIGANKDEILKNLLDLKYSPDQAVTFHTYPTITTALDYLPESGTIPTLATTTTENRFGRFGFDNETIFQRIG